ncbi:MAG: ABC transporter substrate-binding protein [Cetobacterium sp.]|uniref:ABC transporter substrate-binding protein n=1 Tax=Cetobacterium sp. TaxID=2071632 RepID=UPI002FC58B8E
MISRKIKFLFCFFIFVMGLFGKEVEEKVVKIAMGYNGRSYDPHKHTDSATLAITKQIYNNLFYLGENGKTEPELVKSYKIKENGDIEIDLKENIYFHDGKELTAEVVKRSLKRNIEIPITKVLAEPIKEIVLIDKYRLIIKSKYNPKIILNNLTHSSLAIVKEDGNGKLVGTGAFELKEWKNGEKVILSKNKDYFKGEPKVDILEFITIPEAANRYIALETGEIQIAYDLASIDVNGIKNKKDLNLISKLSYGTDFLSINTEKAPLNNKEIRKAIKYALNKEAINQVVFENTAEVANSILTPNTYGYFENKDDSIKTIEEAKNIIKSYKEPISIELWIYEDSSKYQMAQVIQANLKEIGINVEIQTLELSTFLQLSAQGGHNALIGLWYTSTGDADYGLYPLLHNNSRGAVGNRSFYNNEEVNRLLDEARVTLSSEKRLEKYKRVQEIVEDENPIIPLVYKMYHIGLNNNIKNFKFNPNGNHILEKIEFN